MVSFPAYTHDLHSGETSSFAKSWLLIIFLMGVTVGNKQHQSIDDNVLLHYFISNFAPLLVPVYTFAVIVYLTSVAFRKELEPLRAFLEKYFPRPDDIEQERNKNITGVAQQQLAGAAFETSSQEDAEEEQPVNMSGAYKLVSNDNFEGFLAVQGVPWALRRAANGVRPTHRITHVGRRLTIKIEGIIESQTTYLIGGPPVETDVRGRIFQDVVRYLESGKGVIVTKKALSEDYDITVQRELSDCKQRITMTSTAFFRDGRESVKCVQQFKREK